MNQAFRLKYEMNMGPEADSHKTMRLGQLLIEAGFTTPEALQAALSRSERLGVPIGRVLVMSCITDEHMLRAALQAQSLLRDGALTLPVAVEALRTVQNTELPLEEVLMITGWEAPKKTNRLGELLVEAGVVSEETVKAALNQGWTNGMPLGRHLVLTGAVPERVINAALDAQRMIRDGAIRRERAIEELRAAS